MATKTINVDFKQMYKQAVDAIIKFYNQTIHYFKTLTQDMMIAWAVLGVGLVVFIVGLCL